MIIIEKYCMPRISMQTVTALIFALGFAALIILILGCVIFAAWLLNLALSAITEVVTHLVSLYTRSDSLIQFFMVLIVGYILYRLARTAYCSLSK
jgi:hypothetical protein